MKRNLIFVALLILCVTVLAAHPHYQRSSSVTVAEGKEISLTHVTFPWNEANPDRFPAEGWSVPGAKLNASMELSSGSNAIPAGEYTLKITRNGEDFDMHLVNGSQTYALESKTQHGLSMQDHLMMDVHVTGDSGYVSLRYGTFNVLGQIKATE